MENTNNEVVEKNQSTDIGSQPNVEQTSVQSSDFFGLHQKGSNLKTEILAGCIIFMSMFYIVPVQGAIIGWVLVDTGQADPTAVATIGIITAFTAGIMSILMGVYGRHPAALASGMGVNAFVAYTLMYGGMPYGAALSAVLISGIIFIIVSVTPVRQKILNAVPDDIKKAISIGVGLFLMFVALSNGGVIANMGSNPSLGTATGLGPLNDPVVILSIIAIFITIILWLYDIPGAVLIAMGVTAAIGIGFTLVGWEASIVDTNGNPIVLPSLNMDWSMYGASFKGIGDYAGQSIIGLGDVQNTWASPTWYMAIFVLFLNDFFDTTGTLFGLNSAMEEIEVDEATNKRVLIVDAIGTTFGSVSGTTNITIFAESASGVNAGGRTGITSITTGVLFLLSIPIIPILTPIFTPSVTTGAIVLVGIMMASQLKDINVEDRVFLTSSVFTIMFMILGYSIGLGIVVGLLTFIVLMLVTGRVKEVDWVLLATSPLFLAFLVLPIFV